MNPRHLRRNLSILSFLVLSALPAWLAGSGEPGTFPGDTPARIVTCGKAHSLVLNALYMFPEASRSVVAFGADSQVGGNFIAFLDPEVRQKALLAPDPGVEEILAHKPDTVVLKRYLQNSLGRQLEDMQVDVLYVDLESPDQFRRDIDAIGGLFANPQRAEKLKRYYSENLEWIAKRREAIPDEQRPDTLLLYYGVRAGTASFNVPPKAWLQSSLVLLAGGNPVWFEAAATSGWQQVNFEQIAAWDPQHILLVAYHTPAEEVKARLLSDAKWSRLRAARENRLLAFPADFLSWDQPDPRWILGLYWLASRLQPQWLGPAEVADKVREFYGLVYDVPPERYKREILPLVRGDFP